MTAIREIFQQYGSDYISRFEGKMPGIHKKAVNDVCNCRTGECGMAVYSCAKCNEIHHGPLSCGNRHCPACQHLKTIKWTERAIKNKLPAHYFLATFTVPVGIRRFIRSHQKDAYGALFKSSSEAMRKLAADPKHIGGDVPGFFGVLHTWGRQIQYHPHIHYVIAGGAVSTKDNRWRPSPADFYLPVKPLSIIFKAKFRDMMKEKGLFHLIPKDVWKIDWNVNIQPTRGSDAIGYLSQYVFKVAISNHRIEKAENGSVTFRYKKSGSNRPRRQTLDADEFIRRFLQHVLPRGFMKIRYYGFMHPCSSYSKTVKSLIELSMEFDVEQHESAVEIKPADPKACPTCGGKLKLMYIVFSFAMPESGFDTS